MPARTTRIVVVFVLALALLAVLAVAAYRQSREQQALAGASLRAQDLLTRIARVEAEAGAMEAEHRGFLVLGDPGLEAARDRHYETAGTALQALASLATDAPAQAALSRVADALELRHARMAEASAIAAADGLDAARAHFRDGGGALAQSLRVAFDVLEARERAVLQDRADAVARVESHLRLLLLVGSGTAFAALAGALVALLRQQRRVGRMHARLARNEALQRAVIENAGYMIIATDPEGTITLFNRAASQALGHAPADVVGSATPGLFHDPEEVRARAAELSAELGRPVEPGFEAFVARAREGELEDRRWTYLRSDGGRFPVQLAVSAVRADDGTLLGFVGVARDISERDRVEAEVRSLNAALQAKADQLELTNRELESFSYSVSHDLRAPLRHVDGYARMLEEDAAERLEAEHRRFLGAIRDGARRMGVLIDDLLDLSRLGRRPLARARVDMCALAHDAAMEVCPADAAGRVLLDELPPAVGDPALLRQVWINLLANALKYSAPRGAGARVQVEGGREDGMARYTVRDNGVGFDMRYADKLFGVFQRLHRAEEFEGTGVGLAIVHRVVTRHGGTVEAFGEPGNGAAFTFRLPAAEHDA